MNKVTLLGVKGGTAIRQGGAMPSLSLLHFGDQTVLIDCGIPEAKWTAQVSQHWNGAVTVGRDGLVIPIS